MDKDKNSRTNNTPNTHLWVYKFPKFFNLAELKTPIQSNNRAGIKKYKHRFCRGKQIKRRLPVIQQNKGLTNGRLMIASSITILRYYAAVAYHETTDSQRYFQTLVTFIISKIQLSQKVATIVARIC